MGVSLRSWSAHLMGSEMDFIIKMKGGEGVGFRGYRGWCYLLHGSFQW
jgi:hypothetical protein